MKQLLLTLFCAGLGLCEAAAQQVVPPLKTEFLDSAFAVLPSAAGARYRRETEWRDSIGGEVRDYFLSGQLQSRRQYEDVRHAVGHGTTETWYAAGQLKSHCEENHGKPSSEYLLYYPGGQVKNRVRYLNGALDDSWCFTPDGQKMECPAAISTLPVYSGGNGSAQAVSEAVSSNFHYPRSARKANIAGRLIVSFEVDTRGDVINAHVEQGIAPIVDEEALRAVYELKKFRPGTQAGKPITVHYRLPLALRLE